MNLVYILNIGNIIIDIKEECLAITIQRITAIHRVTSNHQAIPISNNHHHHTILTKVVTHHHIKHSITLHNMT